MDTLLLVYLATLTKGAACVDELAIKFQISGEGRQKKHGRMALF